MSITLTPSIGYNADGSEFVDYSNSSIEDSSYSEFLGSKGQELSQHEDYIYDPATDSYRHKYSDIDGSELERRLEAESDPDYSEEEEEESSYDPQVAELAEIAGNDPQYQQMIAWAAQNLSSEMIEEFDLCMDNGTYEQVCWYIERLSELYQESYTYL